MYAAQKGYPDTVRILLEHGAEICGEWHTIIFSISINPSIYLYTFICVFICYNYVIIICYRSNMYKSRTYQSYNGSKGW